MAIPHQPESGSPQAGSRIPMTTEESLDNLALVSDGVCRQLESLSDAESNRASRALSNAVAWVCKTRRGS